MAGQAWALFTVLLPCLTAWGGGASPVSLRVLTDRSDAIVVGEIEGSSVLYDRVSLNVDVVRVLKGQAQGGSLIAVELVVGEVAVKSTRFVKRERGLFFLERSATGVWVAIPPVNGHMADGSSAFIPLPRNVKTVVLPNGVQASTLDRVIAEETSILEGDDRRALTDIVGEYRKNRSPALKELFAKLRRSANPKLKVIGMRAGVVEGDVGVLDEVLRELPTLNEGAVGAIALDVQYYFTNSSQVAAETLGRIAASSTNSVPLRFASAAALARMHTQSALPHLAALIDDGDVKIRSLAIAGLSMFANNVQMGELHPAPGEWKYRTEQTISNAVSDERLLERDGRVVAFWRNWWLAHRADLN